MFEQFKAYIFGGTAVLILLLALFSWIEYDKVQELTARSAQLEQTLETRTTQLSTCSTKVTEFNEAQERASREATEAIKKAREDAIKNYESSREFGSAIPKYKSDYMNTTDLMDKYIVKRQSELK